MLITETRNINGTDFLYNASDAGFYIENTNGVRYEEAYDPINSGRVYTETDTPIEHDEPDENAAYAEAGRILMGVNE